MDEKEKQSCLNRLFSNHKAAAKRRGKAFELDKETFIELSLGECVYCGSEPSNELKYRGLRLSYNGIDRLDNSKGYVEGNVVSCCTFCNGLRGAMKFETWGSFINSVAAFHGGNPPFEFEEGSEEERNHSNKRYFKGW